MSPGGASATIGRFRATWIPACCSDRRSSSSRARGTCCAASPAYPATSSTWATASCRRHRSQASNALSTRCTNSAPDIADPPPRRYVLYGFISLAVRLPGAACGLQQRLANTLFDGGLRMEKQDVFGARSRLGDHAIYRLDRLQQAGIAQIDRLPYTIRILLENVLRNCDGYLVREEDVVALARWQPQDLPASEVPFIPARI